VGQHAVESGGAWHHPSCPQLGLKRQTFEKTRRESTAIERLLILFRDHSTRSGVAFYVLGLSLVVVLVSSFFVACG
jgi:hypothetical protein